MSDSTIDDALKLLETGRGSQDRLKKIIENFQQKSLISLEDRKYVEALVSQYLSPRQRVKMKKIEPKKDQPTNFPRIRKAVKSEFSTKKNTENPRSNSEKQTFDKQDIKFCIECGTENPNSNNFCNNCGSILSTKESNTIRTNSQSFRKEGKKNTFAEYEREYLNRVTGETDNSSEKDTSLEEKFVKQIEHGIPKTKKSSSSGKIAGIIGIIAIIVIGGGAAALTLDFDISNNTTVLERATCDSKTILVSTTKIPGFPDPEKDLQHYLDRYSNEPNYADWFDRNFPGMTIEEIVC